MSRCTTTYALAASLRPGDIIISHYGVARTVIENNPDPKKPGTVVLAVRPESKPGEPILPPWNLSLDKNAIVPKRIACR